MFARFFLLLAICLAGIGVVARTSQGSGQAQVYVVRPADTLWSIAQAHYGGDPREGVWKVTQANHLDAGVMLRPGEKLVLP